MRHAASANTCESAQGTAAAPHKWTVRYCVSGRQREQSFKTLTEAQTFQLTLSTGKQTQGAMFVDPRAGIVEFLPLARSLRRCGAWHKPCPRTKAMKTAPISPTRP